MKRYIYKMSDLRGLAARTKMIGVTSTAGVMTALVASSVVQATDLQIYTVPTAGKKTIVMMLDTSGSMGTSSTYMNADYPSIGSANSSDTGGSGEYTYTRNYRAVAYSNSSNSDYQKYKNICYNPNLKADGTESGTQSLRCYDRLSRLKDGMYALLDSNNPVLNSVRIGVGHFSSLKSDGTGNGTSGTILVPAAALGPVDSEQRNKIKTAIKSLKASNGTPTPAAYAEAASYLMGTNTRVYGNFYKDIYKKVDTTKNGSISGYECNNNSYPHLNGSLCYQYSGYGGSTSNPTITYNCDGLTNTPYLRSSDNKCYQTRTGGAWSGYTYSGANVNANRVTTCSNGRTLNPNDNKCYQYTSGYNGNTQPANVIYHQIPVTYYYQCKSWKYADFKNNIQECNGRDTTNVSYWDFLGENAPNISDHFRVITLNTASTVYQQLEYDFDGSADSASGFNISADSTKDPLTSKKSYLSPLPAVADRQSCDGQGIYVLSDGKPEYSTSDSTIATIMQNSLKADSFNCSEAGGLSSNGWNCMSIYAKKLFNPAANPTGVSIQTAFVGFGKSFSDLSTTDVKNACKMTSRSQVDRSSDDKCSPNQDDAYKTAEGGYGNGGFFIANNANEVTNSVIQFINNLGVAPLDPLSTGAISVPVDALNPSGYQPFGYLRALEPNPAMPVKVWMGNLKKYSIENGALKADAVTVFDSSGVFNRNTRDMWNTVGLDDGGVVRQGGVYSQLPMPTTSSPGQLRNLLTDVALDGSNTPVKMTDYSKPLLVVPQPTGSQTTLDAFTSQSILKDFSTTLKVKLLNYLGYDLDLTTNEVLPTSLTAPNNPFISMGGSIHSFPVQLTYSGDLDSAGNLTDVRKQSVLYGSMEGALRIVDAETGEEQMAFVPADILLDTEASRALRLGEGGNISHGVSGAWVADPTYRTVRSSKKDEPSTIEAKTMNVYGGLRMGGESYYGLDALDPKVPKVLFRIGSDQADYARMGQTWSKPVLINVRHNGKIKRAMVVGGGYDMCYENPRFKLTTANPIEFQIKNAAGAVTDTCEKEQAKGNAIYVVDATSGEKLWWASNATSDTSTAFYNSNPNLKHSIVSRISTLDRDGDGLIDHLYFGDLGGQVFRADLDNKQNLLGTVDGKDVYSPFGVRVTRMANLGQSLKTDDSGDHVGSADLGDSPRFYQAPTVTIHDQGTNTFIAVTIASGDRSTPLDVSPTQGRESMLPSVALTDRPVNNVYSIFDHDFIKKTLITGTVNLVSKNLVLGNLQKDPQLLADGTYIPTYFTESGIGKYGWYRSLSSQPDGTELAGRAVGGVTRVAGGVKAFEEEPIAISNNFFVPIYDPQGNSIAAGDPCKPRIVGESNRQQYCLPYGVCLTTAGYKNTGKEDKTGFQLVEGKNANVLGAGIRGISLGPSDSSQTGGGKNSCGSLTLLGNIEGAGQWDCQRIFNPTRWYEKYVTAK